MTIWLVQWVLLRLAIRIILSRCALAGRDADRQTLLIFSAGRNLVAGTRNGLGESTDWVVRLQCDRLPLTNVVVVVDGGKVGHKSTSAAG